MDRSELLFGITITAIAIGVVIGVTYLSTRAPVDLHKDAPLNKQILSASPQPTASPVSEATPSASPKKGQK